MSLGARADIPALTGLRGVAALWVTLYHLWHAFGAPRLAWGPLDLTGLVAAGYFGVDLFFVLSGFLLGGPFIRAAVQRQPLPALAPFWRRRLLRVLPAYWVQLTVLFALAWWLGRLPERPLLALATHAALVFNLVPYQVQPINPVYWSLPVEWDFYIVLPLLALLLRWLRWPGLIASALAIGVAWRLLCWSTVYDVPPTAPWSWWAGAVHQLPGRLDQFVLGMLAAALAPAVAPRPRLAGVLLALGAIGAAGAALLIGPRGDVFSAVDVPLVFVQFTVLGVIFATACLGAGCADSRLARLLSTRPAIALGAMSYSLYLWHYPLLQWQSAFGLSGRVGAAVALLLTLVAIGVVSAVSYRFVERPFLAPRRPRTLGAMPAHSAAH